MANPIVRTIQVKPETRTLTGGSTRGATGGATGGAAGGATGGSNPSRPTVSSTVTRMPDATTSSRQFNPRGPFTLLLLYCF